MCTIFELRLQRCQLKLKRVSLFEKDEHFDTLKEGQNFITNHSHIRT